MGAPTTKSSPTLRYARLLSFISITFTLFILGVLGLIYTLEQGLSHQVRERISLAIEVPEEAASSPKAFLAQLQALPYIREVEYISPDSAAKSLTTVLGEDPTKVLGYNPLLPMAKIYLKAEYTHPDSLRQLVAHEPLLQHSQDFAEQEKQWATASNNLQTVRFVLLIFLGLQLLVSFLQINTATGLVIYSHRMRIRTLSLIGATAGFIRRPFIRRAVLEGLFGSIVSLALLAGLVYGADQLFGLELLPLLPLGSLMSVLIAVPAVGVLVSFVSSWRASRRYIHMEEGKIHLI